MKWVPINEIWYEMIAIDGKTSRRSHDRAAGKRTLHLVSALASHERRVLGREAVDEKSYEIKAIPALLQRLTITGALVSIDAIACPAKIARTIPDAGGDDLLAVKGNQATLEPEIRSYFETAPEAELQTLTFSTRTMAASRPEPTAGPRNATG